MSRVSFVVLIILALFSTKAKSSSIDYASKLYNSYLTGEMGIWVDVIEDLSYEYEQNQNQNQNNSTLYSLIQTQYGYIGYLIGIKDYRMAKRYLANAEANVEKLLQQEPKKADALAFKAAFLAYHIAINPFRAPFIGPKSMAMIDDALALNGNALQALLEKANASHYAPSMFGGNPVEAVKYYTKAIEIFEKKNGGEPPKSWLYLNAYAQLALAFEKANLTANASRTYKRILSIAPNFKWVKDELYPQFQKRNS
jgi:tetratricopeptide (TPR) repeat protein